MVEKDKKDKRNKDETTSISSPLGHITVDSDFLEESLVDWVKDVLDEEDRD